VEYARAVLARDLNHDRKRLGISQQKSAMLAGTETMNFFDPFSPFRSLRCQSLVNEA
jgi:hypothetical protein